MISADWKAVWDALMVAYGHQPMEMRVGIALAAAFLALMVLEGLRARFLPRRHAPAPARKVEAAPPPAAAIPEPAKPQAMAPVRAYRTGHRHTAANACPCDAPRHGGDAQARHDTAAPASQPAPENPQAPARDL